jgi:hypothetical protein
VRIICHRAPQARVALPWRRSNDNRPLHRLAATDPPQFAADDLAVPDAPTVGSALRSGLRGFAANNAPLIVANVAWGAALIVTLGLVLTSLPIALMFFLFVLPLPTAGLYQVAALIVRDEPVSVSDALAWRTFGARAIAAGSLVGGSSAVLAFNVVLGISSLDPVGWAAGTAAFWGLVLLWMVAASVWPLLFDPVRADESATSLVKLALIVALVKPVRYLVLVGILGVVLIVSALLAVALLTISAAFFALAMSFYAIHAGDRIERRRTIVVTG